MPRGTDRQIGLDFKWDTEALIRINEAAFKRGARKAAAFLAGEIKKALSERQFPPASSPGQTPAIRTGLLRNSVQSKGMPFGARVGVVVMYGLFLELGTAFMAARPFIAPTFIQNLPRIKAIVAAEMAQAHRGT